QVPGLRAIPHRVTFRASGYVTEQRWIKPGAEVSVELLRGGVIHGWVEDSNGRPVRRAELEVNGKAITGEAVHMVGPVQEAPALAPVQRPISGDDSLGVTTGSVPRIPLRAASFANANQLAAVGFESEDDGSFHLEGLPPGQLVITARRATLGTGHSATVSLRPGAVLEDVRITLPRGKALSGRVIDAQGHLVPHVRVDLAIAGDAVRSITTNNQGQFTFEAARGECTLSARPLGAPAVQISGSADELTQREVTLRLAQTTDRLSGRVLDARGQPLDAVSVRVHVLSLPGFTPIALTEADGSFELSALPAPPYTLDFEHPDQLPIRELSVPSTHTPLVVRMQQGTQLSGQVLDAYSRAPIADAEVSFHADGFRQLLRTQRDGSFELHHVPYGPYELSVASERFVPETQRGRLDAAPGRGLPLQIALTPGAAVSGDVVDALGSTVWNAQVTSGNPPAWEHATRTDHAGHFLLRGLPPGEHALHARHGAVLAQDATTVRTVAGETATGAVIRLPKAVDDEAERNASPPSAAASATSWSGASGGPLRFGSRGGSVVIEHVGAGSAAARAGLTSGDVLLRVNGEPVRSAAQARGMLAPLRGRTASLSLEVRRGQEHYHLRYAPR
ncbi:MAG: carboxypeptidase regulatory-like domain-containing protein, partial [Polyangiales bacterium]